MNKKAIQLPVQTITLVVGFMVWVILSGLIPYIKEDIGSICYGARNVSLISFVLLLFPILYISTANTFTDLLIGGLFIGISGAIFSAGVTSLPKYYPMYFSKQAGIVNGIVSAVGGLGGFFPLFILSILYNVTGHYAIGYMAFLQVALASLIIVVGMFDQERLNHNKLETIYPTNKIKHG